MPVLLKEERLERVYAPRAFLGFFFPAVIRCISFSLGSPFSFVLFYKDLERSEEVLRVVSRCHLRKLC